MAIAYSTRKEHFSACHRLHSSEFADEENKEFYAKCNNLNGHGHNYIVEVTVRGPVDARTGMVMNIKELKIIMNKVIMAQLDHKNLDKDVPYFKNTVSTTENVAIFIWEGVKAIMINPELLYEVKVHSTNKIVVRYRGENSRS